jgi:hypothetical protein
MTLQYRLISNSGSIVSTEPSDKSVILDYTEKTRNLVVEVFTSHGWPVKDSGAGMAPEIISAQTAARIEALSEALEQCRYWMDIQRPPEGSEAAKHWDRLIAEATEALGDNA